jgi:hypothetical protein
VARLSPQWTDDLDDRRDGDDRFDDDDYSVGLRDRAAGLRRTGWARILVLAIIALVLGTVIGLGGSTLLALLSDTGVESVPSLTGSVPTNAVTGSVEPELAPTITELDDRGSSVELTWDDPTDGRAEFVIYHTDDDGDEFVQRTDPGVTRTVVAGLDPDAQHCFLVVAILGDSVGASETRCTSS